MAHYQNLIVAIDPDEEDQAALRRAVYLVRRNGGKIKAFLPIFDFPMRSPACSQDERMAMRQSAIDQRVAWIRQLSHYYIESGVNIEIKVVWHKRYHEAVIEEVAEFGHDLLLKAAHQQDRLESVIFTPIDWHLLRKCACAVWMVKDQPWPEQGKALVSVNLASEEDFHDELNHKLVKESLALAGFADSTELHLVSAYPTTSINIAIELPEFDPTVYNNAIRGQYLIAMKALRQQFGIPEERTHVERGLPEDVIPAVAEEIRRVLWY